MISANRYQEILLSVLSGSTIPVPTNRDEAVLIAFLKEYSGGGSGGGTGTVTAGVQSVSVNGVRVIADSNKNVNLVADTVATVNSKNLITSGAVASHTNNADVHITLEEKAIIRNLLHNRGFFTSEAELNAAHPTGQVGDYATVLVEIADDNGAVTGTDLHMFIWDDTQSKWLNTNIGGLVTSINGKTGDVELTDLPYDNAASGLTATTFKNALDEIVVLVQASVLPENYLTKQEYASEINEGSVKMADKAKTLEGTELAKPFQFWGIDANGNAKYLYLPFENNTDTGAGEIEQRVLLNVVANEILEIGSINNLDECKVFIQAYKFISGEENVTNTVKEFNNGQEDSFYYTNGNIEFDENGCSIKESYEYKIKENSDGFYETEIINPKEYIEIVSLKKRVK